MTKTHPLLPKTASPKISAKLDSVTNGLFDTHKVELAKFEPRCSSLPICPLVYTIDYLKGKEKKFDFSFEFYTKVGTAVHEVLQTAFPQVKSHGRYVYGNWKCVNSECRHVVANSFRVSKCPKCEAKTSYEELSLSYKREGEKNDKNILTGHPDLLWLHPKLKVMFEFKTTSQYNIENPGKFIPVPKHLYQAWAYVKMLKVGGIDIDYIALGYFSRNNAGTGEHSTFKSNKETKKLYYYKVNEEGLEAITQILDATLEGLSLGRQAIRVRDSKKLDGVEKTIKAKVLSRKLSDMRPCKAPSDYKNFMEHSFSDKEPCAYAKAEQKGGCFSPEVNVQARRDLSNAILGKE